MATTLAPSPVSTRQLDWNPTTRRYVGEISSTNGLGRVFDDACDEGLTLVSAATGRSIVFVVDSIDRDAENEITAWVLRPATDHELDVTVVLFND